MHRIQNKIYNRTEKYRKKIDQKERENSEEQNKYDK